jgi:hypothetical protein
MSETASPRVGLAKWACVFAPRVYSNGTFACPMYWLSTTSFADNKSRSTALFTKHVSKALTRQKLRTCNSIILFNAVHVDLLLEERLVNDRFQSVS